MPAVVLNSPRPRGAMLKKGTYCYVVGSCRASPAAQHAVGKIVEVVAGPYNRAGDAVSSYDVRYRNWILYCHADKLRAINDPDADVGERHNGNLVT